MRRDRIRLRRQDAGAGAAGLNTVSGRVSAMEYQGSWLKITLEEACGEEFVVNQADSIFFADPLDVGDPVLAQWQPEEVHFLAAGEQTVRRVQSLRSSERPRGRTECAACAGCS